MALTVATNTGALMAQAAASSVNKEMEQSMERLSTGKRINSAADDAAGVAIASRLSAEIRGTNQAIRNAMDGQALIDTAEGAHIEIENILQRMRELSVQARNDTNDSDDRSNLQLEMNALTEEINRISSVTAWAGQKLLTGSGGNSSNGTFNMQVGSQTAAEDIITATITSMSAAALGVGQGNATAGANGATLTAKGAQVLEIGGTPVIGDAYNFTLNGDVVSLEITAESGGNFTFGTVKVNGATLAAGSANNNALDLADITLSSLGNDKHAVAKAIANTITALGDTGDGPTHAGMTATAASDGTVTLNQTVAVSGANFDSNSGSANDIAGTLNTAGDKIVFTGLKTDSNSAATDDFALTVNGIDLGFSDMKTNFAATSAGVLAAVKETIADHANEMKGITLTAAYNGNDLEISIAKATALTSVSAVAGNSSTALSVSSVANAKDAIDKIDLAIKSVNNQRASLGAISNRLDSTVNNLTNISSNLQAGRGRIQDADFAAETTSLAKSQILQQASTAMLAQANASKQNVLSLLQG